MDPGFPDVMADGYGSRNMFKNADDPFRGGGRQSAEASPRSDVFPTLQTPQSPPRQHSPVRNSPPPVSSPARRRMYKSEIQTSSTESATNASSSQHLETETSYMSHDTSRLEKKKKTSTKALVKRLLGVVADLSSKVDRVLQKKDEPDTILNQTEGFERERKR
ncbi:unnamed protein product [Lactuca virosa]|uniref:Uncharacterized protein n=1 Tax=Lactuca virosa TaxID=75947 RepID=A0AAU9MGY7_9ASTR|nr:unnamed protein product [Lactuca virosa]